MKKIKDTFNDINTKKVYCKDCTYLYVDWIELLCTHPKLTEWNFTPYSKYRYYIGINNKKAPNKNNTCPYYKKKWWKIWL